VDLQSLFNGPTRTNKTLIPSLLPSCIDYEAIGTYIAKVVFGK
jgi:hypothetical protein